MSESEALFRELWAFVGVCPLFLSKKLIKDIYSLGKLNDKEESVRYECLCWCCRDVALAIKGRLPDNIHNRLVLGSQNWHASEYVRKWGV